MLHFIIWSKHWKESDNRTLVWLTLLHPENEPEHLMYPSNRHPHKLQTIILHRSVDIVFVERNGLLVPSKVMNLITACECLDIAEYKYIRIFMVCVCVCVQSCNFLFLECKGTQRQTLFYFMLLTLTWKPNESLRKGAFLKIQTAAVVGRWCVPLSNIRKLKEVYSLFNFWQKQILLHT